jgi:molybdate transport system regulatory protein
MLYNPPAKLEEFKRKKSKVNRMALLRLIHDRGSISAAAKILGISYKAAWVAVEEVNSLSAKPLLERSVGGEKGGGTVLTEHGLKVIKHIEHFEEAFQDFLEVLGADDDAVKEFRFYTSIGKLKTSARNRFGGRVEKITRGAAKSEVILDIGDGLRVVGMLANKSVDGLELTVGSEAFALIKASSVIVAIPGLGFKSSARNQFSGTVSRCEEEEFNCEVTIELTGGKSIAALITNESLRDLGLTVGDQATALVKASHTHITRA